MNRSSVLKNTLIAAVIAIAGIVAFTGCGKNKGTGAEVVKTAEKGIAYIELDSVIANFDMATDKTTELEEKTKN